MTRRARNALSALRDFLRGFLGWAAAPGALPSPGDAAAARRALEERAARRPSCC
ncbi:MAG: hypothetical protein OZ948_14300 [Deltaproteobacteria bacterium]|nr:hypothetical protein [Deltaproteobacteria bacterium]